MRVADVVDRCGDERVLRAERALAEREHSLVCGQRLGVTRECHLLMADVVQRRGGVRMLGPVRAREKLHSCHEARERALMIALLVEHHADVVRQDGFQVLVMDALEDCGRVLGVVERGVWSPEVITDDVDQRGPDFAFSRSCCPDSAARSASCSVCSWAA